MKVVGYIGVAGLGVWVVLSSVLNAEDALTTAPTPSDFAEFSEWRNLPTEKALSERSFGCHEYEKELFEERLAPRLKVGPTYNMASYDPSFVSWSRDLLVSPTEAIAKTKLYAFDVTNISQDQWTDVRSEVIKRGSNPNMSVVIQYGSGFVGTPVKWNSEAAETIAAMMEISAAHGLPDNEPVKMLAASVVDSSTSEFSGNGYPASAKDKALFISYDCNDWREFERQHKVFVGLSFVPDALKNQEPKQVITESGIEGQRLGSEIPGWPTTD